jgi:tRNA dimethylallyltransferase
MKKKIICLIGPTAVGKTDVAVILARRIGAEIISCDSMQIYKGIDIATSKPTKKQRELAPHHLLDIVKPYQEYNAARFRIAAKKAIKEIQQRGKIPLIIAGTGLYLDALLDGLFTGPGQNAKLRKKFSQQAQRYGIMYLYSRLKKVDPQAAQNIHAHDFRRISRALEVYTLTRKPISQWKKETYGIRDKYAIHIFGLQRQRDDLYTRIEERVDRMFRQGLIAEIKRLTKQKLSRTAKSVLGYKEVKGFLDGLYSRDEAKRLLQKNTRRYAKRQCTWFRREKAVRWIDIGAKQSAKLVAKKISALLTVGKK